MRICVSAFMLFGAGAALFAGLQARAQSPDLEREDRDMVRVVRHPDGARSIYKREKNKPGMRSVIYYQGKMAAINDYLEGKYGQLVGCNIYDYKRELIYQVSYGYDRSGRLVEERMYSAGTKKFVQRVIYKYDAAGNRSKPIIISLNTNSQVIDMRNAVKPTMEDGDPFERPVQRNRR
ncbi:MAG: hypothetical protein LIO63_03160 [Akkermansia sp.]|nr:hypothetical protein [Akkermansia sp.]